MTEQPMTVNPPHRWVADRMGYSVAGVSLLRSGNRRPTLQTMEVVQEAFGWEMASQIEHRFDYADAFNQVITDAYNAAVEQGDQ